MILLKKSELAKIIGVSKSYISKLLKLGILTERNGLVSLDEYRHYKDLKHQLLEVKLENELIRGEMLKARVKELESKYIPVQIVKEVLKKQQERLRRAFSLLPDRVVNKIVGLKEGEIHQILMEEIRSMLFALSNDAKFS